MSQPLDCSAPDSIAAADPDVDRAMRAAGDAWRDAFDAACRRESVLGALTGPPTARKFSFEPQDTASSELILETFLRELESRGVKSGPTLFPPPGLAEEAVRAAAVAIDDAVRRVRTLLVEFNSYLSGGAPWVFSDAPAPVIERGLSVYRYPKLGAADVTFAAGGVDVDFAAGDLGEVTSSGFYVPTALRGDFTASIRYEIRAWRPGDDQACFALFTHDEASTMRFYAQRNSAAGEPGVAQANLAGRLDGAIPIDGPAGRFRLVRRGAVVSVSHALDASEWVNLSEYSGDRAPDMIVGAKIWSSGVTGGLAVRFTELTLDGVPSPEQSPAPETRPDPRAE